MKRQMPIVEFVALMAALFALVAFSTDSMLPSFPAMVAELTPGTPNRIQLVIAVFMAGLGIGTFVTGPLADAFGRKPVMLGGMALYVVGALISSMSSSLEMLLAGRVLQGLGCAGPRIATLAMVRDLFNGRRMAQLTSFIMTVFMLFPAIAPYVGSTISAAFGWRAVFLSFILFALICAIWLGWRRSETLAIESRRPLRIGKLAEAGREIVLGPAVMLYTVALTLGFTELLATISSIQPIYDVTFNLTDSFPLWFALGALVAASGTIVNAALVMRLGMRRLALTAFAGKVILTVIAVTVFRLGLLSGTPAFALWFVWSTSTFFGAGLIFGNLNALALQPLGHIAGTAASLITGISTVGAALLAIPIGQSFDGTPVPLMIGNLICMVVAFLLLRRTVDAAAEMPDHG